MFLSKFPIRVLTRNLHSSVRCMSKGKIPNDYEIQEIDSSKVDPPENPIHRTGRVLAEDMRQLKNKIIKNLPFSLDRKKQTLYKHVLVGDDDDKKMAMDERPDDYIFPSHCDILIVGGGAIGSSIAFWLKERARDGLRIVVVEKDKTYAKSSTTLSVGGLRQQFSLEENIQMSVFGAEFVRNIKQHLGDHVDVNFVPHGYLFLASEESAQQLEDNSILQNRLGAKNITLTPKKLKERFPWLNTNGIALGCFGVEKEGWFDPWALLMGFKHQAQNLGVDYIDGEVVKFEFEKNPNIQVQGVPFGEYRSTNHIIVKLNENDQMRRIKFATCIIAAGAQSGHVGRLAHIGTGPGMLAMPLPVEPRKRYVYSIKTQGDNCPGLNTPLTIDPSQTYFRRDGLCGNFLVGRSPDENDEPSIDNLDVDYDYFENTIWPHLSNRVPAFESAKVESAWSGFYEYNTFDENGIIGPHPYFHNLYVATGFSGHGIQHAPAVGQAIAELILDGQFNEIDLTRLGFDRFFVNEPMREQNIV